MLRYEDLDKLQPLLKAEHHNWGLTKAGDWKRSTYELFYTGELRIKVLYDMPEKSFLTHISDTELSTMKSLISEIKDSFVDKKIQGCDGTAWSFEAFDEDGKTVFKRKLDYIWGIKALETVSGILNVYEPDKKDFDV